MNMKFTVLSVLVISFLIDVTTVAFAQPSPRIGYTVQVGVFKEVKNAERFAKKLNRIKLDAVYFKKKSDLYAVTMGNFNTWAEANKIARTLREKKVIDAYYIAAVQKSVISFNNVSSNIKDGQISHAADLGKIAALTAERFTGIQYHWGGNNVVEGLDCSGFVKTVYNLVGLDIPRTSREQFNEGTTIETNSIREGDLLFFGKGARKVSHVGMYIGSNRFVHAPRRGQPIQVTSLKDERYSSRYIGARRYF